MNFRMIHIQLIDGVDSAFHVQPFGCVVISVRRLGTEVRLVNVNHFSKLPIPPTRVHIAVVEGCADIRVFPTQW